MSANLIRDLVAAGVSGELIQQVAELQAKVGSLEASLSALDTARKANAKRQQRYRDKRVTLCNVTDDPRNVTSRNGDVTPPQHIDPPKKKDPKRDLSISAHQIAADWNLSEEDRAYARSKDWPESRIEAEGERFKNHALATGRRQKDWGATWRNWVTSPLQATVAVNGQSLSAKDVRRNEWRNILDQAGEYIDDQERSDQSGQKTLRLIPSRRG